MCVFKVNCVGREIPCDYTEPVLHPDMSNVIKILQWGQNLSAHLRNLRPNFMDTLPTDAVLYRCTGTPSIAPLCTPLWSQAAVG